MSRKNQIIRAVEGENSEVETPQAGEAQEHDALETAELPELDEIILMEEEEYSPPSNRMAWIVGSLSILTILGWTALYGWAMQAQLLQAASLAPEQWVRWIIDWSVPVLLVCVVWILAMRNSTREANRFAASAAMLSQESAELENRLTVVNRELSLAREFLASQSRDLETLGRIATERLSTNAEELQSLIKSNGDQVEAIGTASDTALANMSRLRDDLPVIANSARDVNNNVGSTGRTAREQLDKLIAGFERLNEFGSASEKQVQTLTDRISKTIEAFEGQLAAVETTLEDRFSKLQSQAQEFTSALSNSERQSFEALNDRIITLRAECDDVIATLKSAEAEGLDQVRSSRDLWEREMAGMVERLSNLDNQAANASQMRIKQLNEEAGRFDEQLAQRDVRFFEEMNRRQEEFQTRETQATEMLEQRLNQLDDTLADKREAQIAETEKLVSQSDTLTGKMEKLSTMIAQVKELGTNARAGLTEGMETLGEQLETKRASLIETEASLHSLTEASVRLLEIIQSGAKHSREDLPEAIQSAAQQLGTLEQRTAALSGAMFTLGNKGDELSQYLLKTNEGIGEADASLEVLQVRVAERSDEALARLSGLQAGLQRLYQESENFTGGAQEALLASLDKLEGATRATVAALQDGAETQITGLAERLSSDAVSAMERALRNESAEAIGKLEQAAAHASGVGREAAVQLRDQLALVNELTGNLEQRVERARELAEEQVDNDFARRMALITDSLNSASIDISNALSDEVSDTAWNSYLKGDRGIFTRRAVRLLENAEARAIADLYQNDETFHANVARYIHDFEAMLRSMLSTRDGNALSVTVLGSDMGKLYVALAQSIERFRN
ncbi:MAG: ATPase [Pseudomonadota bacterium]